VGAGSGTPEEEIADSLRPAAGNVSLIGDPEKYALLGPPVIADVVEGGGPRGGIYTALLHSREGSKLVIARGMAGPDFPRTLIQGAARSPQVGLGPRGIQPRREVLHPCPLPAPESALKRKAAENERLFAPRESELWPVADASALSNVHTPEQWRREVA